MKNYILPKFVLKTGFCQILNLCSQKMCFAFNFIPFEITGDPWNRIGQKWCNLFIDNDTLWFQNGYN